MKILVLGGTRFVGRHLVQAALNAGHRVSTFNRGRTNPELFPGIEKLHGDRDGDLSALKRGEWDAAIDVSGYLPRHVRESATLLAQRAGRYVFISSAAVYRDKAREGQDESSPLETLEDPTVEEVSGETYGGLKVLCEKAAEDSSPGKTLIIRPAYIVGPHDTSDRFTYWVRRIAKGGEVLAPGDPQARIQFTDARDLAEWIIRMAQDGAAGLFNAMGPAEPLTWGMWLETIRGVTQSDAELVWADEEFLVQREAHRGIAFRDLPLWSPAEYRGIAAFDNRKAMRNGLTFRALEETILDVFRWDSDRSTALSTGIPLELERQWLDDWNRHQEGGAE